MPALLEKTKQNILAIILSLFALILLYWFFFIHGYESTDDAYLKANITILSPRVSGYVTEVLIKDNQVLKKGDLIAQIDDRDYKARLRQAEGQVEAMRAQLAALENQRQTQDALVRQSEAGIKATQALHDRAQKDFKRSKELVKDGAISEQTYDGATAENKSSSAQLDRARAENDGAKSQLKATEAQIEGAAAQLKNAEAQLELAQIDLENTVVKAPVDGTIGNKGVQVGQLVRPGTALAYLIPTEIWVEANFKETQIEGMTPGNKAWVTVDSFPNVKFTGKIDSLSPASGSEFSILPPENATGNFTKIIRRVPVKIVLNPDDNVAMLKPGLSTIVKVKTS